jgi:hypothetical protein
MHQFRLELTSMLPWRVTRGSVLVSTTVLATHAFLMFSLGRGSSWLAESCGHGKFLRDVLLNRKLDSDTVSWGWSSREDEKPGKYRVSTIRFSGQTTDSDV